MIFRNLQILLVPTLLAAASGCELISFCEVPGNEEKCIAGDETSTGYEASTGDGDPGDGDGDPGDGDGDPGDGDGDLGDGDGEPGDGDGEPGDVPEPPTDFTLSYLQIKQFDLTWTAALGAEYYRLLERENPDASYVQVGADTTLTALSLTVPLHLRLNASYIVQACNDIGCTDSASVEVVGSLSEAVGYFKASDVDALDYFGNSLALSEDGKTLAVGVPNEDSNATGIGGNPADNTLAGAGAVYVYARDEMGVWTQEAYVKASNTDSDCDFGHSVALSGDGNTLAVGAYRENSGATGVNGNQADDSLPNSGAVYVFARDGLIWAQEGYVKASNTGQNDHFGHSVALSDSGSTLAVGAYREDSVSMGIGGNQADNSALDAGAVYVYTRDQVWMQDAYVKASNTNTGDNFGYSVALSGDGTTLVVGAWREGSVATGIGGNQADNSVTDAGAAYVYTRDQFDFWTQVAYIKSTNTGTMDYFGHSVALSNDGATLVVGAYREASSATGIGGNQGDNSYINAGAAYVYSRDQMGIWTPEAYVKASNTDAQDSFGHSVALSGNGSTLAIGSRKEASGATGIGGNQSDNSLVDAGAVYVYTRDQMGIWTQGAYVKASNTGMQEYFGGSIVLSEDGSTLAVGAVQEHSNATGIGGDQTNDSVAAGAVYLY